MARLIKINEARVDPGEVIGYAHVYAAATRGKPEVSHVRVCLKGGGEIVVRPTAEMHSPDILACLDHAIGIKEP